MCYWFFRLNVCAAVAFLLFNTSRESLEKMVARMIVLNLNLVCTIITNKMIDIAPRNIFTIIIA